MYRALHICSTSALCFFKPSLRHAVKTAALHPWDLSCSFRFQSESPTISHSTGVRGPKYTLNVHTAAPRSLALVKKTGEGNDGMCWTPHFMIRVREGRPKELRAKRSLLRNNTMQEKKKRERDITGCWAMGGCRMQLGTAVVIQGHWRSERGLDLMKSLKISGAHFTPKSKEINIKLYFYNKIKPTFTTSKVFYHKACLKKNIINDMHHFISANYNFLFLFLILVWNVTWAWFHENFYEHLESKRTGKGKMPMRGRSDRGETGSGLVVGMCIAHVLEADSGEECGDHSKQE